MKIHFPRWAGWALLAALIVPPTTSFAQERRPPATRDKRPDTRPRDTRKPVTDRDRERAKEAEETRRQQERAGNPRRREPDRDHDGISDRRERELREALARRERIARERRLAERRDIARWNRLRAERAAARRREQYARWGAAINTPAGRAEFELYSKRKARLNRIRDIAVERNDTALIERTDRVIILENNRHAGVLTVLVASIR